MTAGGDVSGKTDLLNFLADQLRDVETAWSVGAFGAIAEFTRDAEETAALDRDADAISVITARGGIRIEAHEALRPSLRKRSPHRAGINGWLCAYRRTPAP